MDMFMVEVEKKSRSDVDVVFTRKESRNLKKEIQD